LQSKAVKKIVDVAIQVFVHLSSQILQSGGWIRLKISVLGYVSVLILFDLISHLLPSQPPDCLLE
jgi:hypothetical protein